MVEKEAEPHQEKRWTRYDTRHSPFLELQTPLTAGCGSKCPCLLLVSKKAPMAAPTLHSLTLLFLYQHCREAFKTILMLPVGDSAVLTCAALAYGAGGLELHCCQWLVRAASLPYKPELLQPLYQCTVLEISVSARNI